MPCRLSPPTDRDPPAASDIRDAPLRLVDLGILALLMACIAASGFGLALIGVVVVRAALS